MTNFAVCRVCLAFGIKIHTITSVHFQDIFEKLTNQKLITNDGRPASVCYICFSHLRRCCQFANMSQITDEILTEILHCYPELTEENVALHTMEIKNYFFKTPVTTCIISPSRNKNISDNEAETNDFQGSYLVELTEMKIEKDNNTLKNHQETIDLEQVASRIAYNIEKEQLTLEKQQIILEKEHAIIKQEDLEADTLGKEQFILEKEQVSIKQENDDDSQINIDEQIIVQNERFILEKEQFSIKQENEDAELTIKDEDTNVNLDRNKEKEVIVEKQLFSEIEQEKHGVVQLISEISQEVDDKLDAFNNECKGVEENQTIYQEDVNDYILIKSDDEEQMVELNILIEDDKEINKIQCKTNNNIIIGHKGHEVQRVSASNQHRRRQSTHYTCRTCKKTIGKDKKTCLYCKISANPYNSKCVIQKHAKMRSEAPKQMEFICDMCEESFPRKSYLRWHIAYLHY